jgi:hypothetical protein
MLKEDKIRAMLEEDLLWLEKFAAVERTNIYKNDLVEADRKIQRMSAFYEVLGEAPSDDATYILQVIKDKLEG